MREEQEGRAFGDGICAIESCNESTAVLLDFCEFVGGRNLDHGSFL